MPSAVAKSIARAARRRRRRSGGARRPATCPSCGSHDVVTLSPVTTSTCNQCGYTGPTVRFYPLEAVEERGQQP